MGIDRQDEMGRLGVATDQMVKDAAEKDEGLKRLKEEYDNIFELAPCYITVQDKDFKLIRFNREFATNFSAKLGDYCFQAYKGRSERCIVCPVIKTFEDGRSHSSEETGVNRDGTKSHWVVRTFPLKNSKGEIIAAMEMCLDVTQMKLLEEEVKKSEEKYRTIFNTIPNPLFVLDTMTLEVLDCNNNVTPAYGFNKEEILMTPFLDLFEKDARHEYASKIKTFNILNRVKQLRKDGETIYVNIRISSSEYLGREVLLVTTSDITKQMMAEQQLIQASKMSTLGEMATAIAHELNQPLSVIKTASSFLLKKTQKNESIQDEILKTMADEIDSHVDRASRIINHMREFGRKSDVTRQKTHVNEALNRALEIFSQQLKLREIDVVKDLQEGLPPVLADPNRLEQVFINLLVNARDAIEEKWEQFVHTGEPKKILLKSSSKKGKVVIEIKDTGVGIPEAMLNKIFEPFFTTKKMGKGTGLGLSISYGIVQDYDGIIEVGSQEGKGSNFTILFPIPDKF